MAEAVDFLVRAGQLVLFDDVLHIIVDRGAADDAGLHAPVHDLPVDVKARGRIVEHIPVFEQSVQVPCGAVVNRVAVCVRALGKVDFRPVHV